LTSRIYAARAGQMKPWQNWLWILAAGVAWVYLVFALHGRTWTPHEIAGVAIMAAGY